MPLEGEKTIQGIHNRVSRAQERKSDLGVGNPKASHPL